MKNSYKISVILGLLLFIWAGSVSAQLTIDGVFDTTEWAGYSTDGNYVRGVEPGTSASGGDKYDVEFIGLRIDQDANDLTQGTVSFALQTGFAFEMGRLYNGWDHLETGDLAFDFNSDGTFEAAIRFSDAFNWVNHTDGYNLNNSDIQFIRGITEWEGTTYYPEVGFYRAGDGDAYSFSTATSNFDYKIRKYDGSPDGAPGTPNWEHQYLQNGDMIHEDVRTGNDHILEGQFDLAMLTDAGFTLGDDVTLKWTMECGNDYLSHTASTLAAGGGPGGDPVPEPATFMLMGMGLIGFAAVRRRKYNIKS